MIRRSNVKPTHAEAFGGVIRRHHGAPDGTGEPKEPVYRGAGQFGLARRVELTTDCVLGAMRRSSELGSEDQSLIIAACAVPYNKLSRDMGGYRETFAPRCFGNYKTADLRVLFNHDPDYVLGRTLATTAVFWEKPDGLYFECDPPDSQWASDLIVSIDRRDITEADIGFHVLQQRTETRDGARVRVVERAQLIEASVVSFPIYDSTSAKVQRPGELAAGTFYDTSIQKGLIQ